MSNATRPDSPSPKKRGSYGSFHSRKKSNRSGMLRQFEALESRRMMAADLDLGDPQVSVADANSDNEIRVIVQVAENLGMAPTIAAFPEDASVVRTMKHSPIAVVNIPESKLADLAESDGVISVFRDRASEPSLESATALTQAAYTSGWLGYNGSGTTIAILDDGIDDTHPFFGNRIIAQRCYSRTDSGYVSLCPNGQSTDDDASVLDVAACYDGGDMICDHGTHVAGIAAGNHVGAGTPGAPGDGVAPLANIISMQVFHARQRPRRMWWVCALHACLVQ